MSQDASDQMDYHHALLQRIVARRTFCRSRRLRELLLDIGEHTFAGRSDELSEHAFGVRVFGREQSYNTADDAIVRASVRQIRQKLVECFDTEGRDEPLVLGIPKGSYVAVFTPRPDRRVTSLAAVRIP